MARPPIRLLVRFFRALPPVSLPIQAALACSTIVAAAALALGIASEADVLAPVFLVQVLAASSSVAGPARRGHYDLLLTGGAGRLSIGVVHWLMSVAPGVISWLTIAALAVALRGSAATPLLSSGTIVAMQLVSTVPWAATVPFSRLAGGFAWLVMGAAAFTVMPDAFWTTWPAALICPWLIVGTELAASDVTVFAAAGVAAAAMLAALAWIARMDIPLEAPP